ASEADEPDRPEPVAARAQAAAPDLRLQLPESDPRLERRVRPAAVVGASAAVVLTDLALAVGTLMLLAPCVDDFDGSGGECWGAPVVALAQLVLVPAIAARVAWGFQPEGSQRAAFLRALLVNLASVAGSLALMGVSEQAGVYALVATQAILVPWQAAAANVASAPRPAAPRPVHPERDPADPRWGR
ncbi:MAG TPA: hypothetical protein VD838_22065, partial [Anaeromyxobacteraceae bacterium]|nr:hypothetical protein [Anaeromyxobacteraceae bacterium]